MPQGNQKAPSDLARRRRSTMKWLRFWIEVLIAMVIFNIIAAIATWYFILPRLKH